MEIGLRILAFMIDGALCLGTLPLVMRPFDWIMSHAGSFGLAVLPVSLVMFVVWPVLYFAVPTAIWGKTPGKLVCRLSVMDYRGRRPDIWRALGREVLKLLAVSSGLGAMLTLLQILYTGETWYDQVCGTGVTFRPYVRLTPTQKRWRKFFNENR